MTVVYVILRLRSFLFNGGKMSNDLPFGDRKIAEMLDNSETEAGAKVREIIDEQINLENLATQGYIIAMSIALG
jgi:hypothetical protein